MALKALWHGTGLRPQSPPNPNYPDGLVVDMSVGYKPRCGVKLPRYPAESLGTWVVYCEECSMSVAVTAASRVDDPKEVIVNCKVEQ